jgi:hypothetical protein
VAAGQDGVWSSRNLGGGSFDRAVQIVAGQAHSLVVNDLTGDGPADLVVAFQNEDAVSVLPGDGRGGFGAPLEPIRLSKPAVIVPADLDGDGRPDLVVGGEAGLVVLRRAPKP